MTAYLDSELQLYSQLVICYEHRDKERDTKSVDNRIFVMYDTNNNDYYICGKRGATSNIKKHNYPPYAFHTGNSSNVLDFIMFAIGYNEKYSVTLYNFNNIFNKTDVQLTYEFFERMMDKHYEIAAYDDCNSSDATINLQKQVKLLKHMCNCRNINYNNAWEEESIFDVSKSD